MKHLTFWASDKQPYYRTVRTYDPVNYEKRKTHLLGDFDHVLYKRYHIRFTDYDRLYSSQGGMCKICFCSLRYRTHSTHLDHNHKTKQIRGLLCSNCNLMLGHAKDQIGILTQAVEYLRNV